jgi:hypothetical protein
MITPIKVKSWRKAVLLSCDYLLGLNKENKKSLILEGGIDLHILDNGYFVNKITDFRDIYMEWTLVKYHKADDDGLFHKNINNGIGFIYTMDYTPTGELVEIVNEGKMENYPFTHKISFLFYWDKIILQNNITREKTVLCTW